MERALVTVVFGLSLFSAVSLEGSGIFSFKYLPHQRLIFEEKDGFVRTPYLLKMEAVPQARKSDDPGINSLQTEGGSGNNYPPYGPYPKKADKDSNMEDSKKFRPVLRKNDLHKILKGRPIRPFPSEENPLTENKAVDGVPPRTQPPQLFGAAGEELPFYHSWPKHVDYSFRPIPAFPEIHHADEQYFSPPTEADSNGRNGPVVQAKLPLIFASLPGNKADGIEIPKEDKKPQIKAKNSSENAARHNRTKLEPTQLVIVEEVPESMVNPEPFANPSTSAVITGDSLTTSSENDNSSASAHGDDGVRTLGLERQAGYVRSTRNEPTFESWLVYKSDAFQPVKPFPEVHGGSQRNSADEKVENERLISPQVEVSPERAGPSLFPASIFERELRVPFF